MARRFASPAEAMQRAIDLASLGLGRVEPNPPVGAVIVDDNLKLIGEGYHRRFGEPHAEIEAIADAQDRAVGQTLFVTLEPCCHQGKTGPCTRAILEAGLKRVVIAAQDPFPQVDGRGIAELRSRGVEVEIGLLEETARRLIAPFAKLTTTGLPWIHAKWAMSVDGKIATSSGESKWISNESSRAVVHALRGRVDVIVVGANTAIRDDPMLDARPPGPRVASRIVVDSRARLPLTSQLARTAKHIPLIVATTSAAPVEDIRRLREVGAEVLVLPGITKAGRERVDLGGLAIELGRRRFTHVLVEGGGELLGALFDQGLVDEVHAFIAPRVIGGEGVAPVAGRGRESIDWAGRLNHPIVSELDGDVYVNGLMKSL